MFYSIIFKHLLLMNDTITLASIIVITRQSFIQSSNAIASIFFSSHAELLSSIPIHSLRSQNITSEKWYVITAGTYGTKEAASAVLQDVQRVCSDAYIKYSGNWQG